MLGRGERGQGIIELALIVPFLVLTFLGVVDYSRFLYFQQVITSAARVGADMAINHCSSHATCGMTDSVVGDDYIIQAVSCDASPTVTLAPQPSTCNSCQVTACDSPTPICDSTCLAGLCVKDICVNPTAANRVNGDDVTVYVGYSYQPITPIIAHFFPVKSCWSSDPLSNQHTLCAQATGSVY